MMPRRIRSSLMLRTTLAVLVAAVVVGMVALALAGRVASRWERRRQLETMENQMDGVESVASAACFVEDRGLAEQIVQRLVATRTVQSAILRTGTTELAKATRGRLDLVHGPQLVSRRLQSPFIKQVQVGELVLAPDPQQAEQLGARTAFLLRVVVLGLTGTLVLTLGFTLHRSIVRPIALLSDRLHRLDAETGALLYFPPGHEQDEIGGLVRDVNALLERLVLAITQERELSERVKADPGRLEAARGLGTGVFVADREGALKAWTPALLQLLEEPPAPAKGDLVQRLFGAQGAQVDACLARCRNEAIRVKQTLSLGAPGAPGQRWLQLCLDPIEGNLIQGLLADVTPLPASPLFDPLTGLMNRPGAEQAWDRRWAKGDGALALMLVNLDHFKRINQSHGREAGDAVLGQVAQRLGAQTGDGDLLARLGEDEFLLVRDGVTSESAALTLARQWIQAIGAPVVLPGGDTVQLGASVGVVLHRGPEPSWPALLRRAAVAVEQAKQAGRNAAMAFRPGP
jgi:diguanylate cyclase (GGDEF)-like protein